MSAFFVSGTPAPKGSARAIQRGGFAVLVPSTSDANKRAIKSWTQAVGWKAKASCSLLTGPIAIEVRFHLARGATVKRGRPSVKPDIDKLLRSTFDALTGIAWADDAQVVEVTASKWYVAEGGEPGAWIRIQPAIASAEGK